MASIDHECRTKALSRNIGAFSCAAARLLLDGSIVHHRIVHNAADSNTVPAFLASIDGIQSCSASLAGELLTNCGVLLVLVALTDHTLRVGTVLGRGG